MFADAERRCPSTPAACTRSTFLLPYYHIRGCASLCAARCRRDNSNVVATRCRQTARIAHRGFTLPRGTSAKGKGAECGRRCSCNLAHDCFIRSRQPADIEGGRCTSKDNKREDSKQAKQQGARHLARVVYASSVRSQMVIPSRNLGSRTNGLGKSLC